LHVLDFISHIAGVVLDHLGRPGSTRAWIILLGCLLVIALALTWMLGHQDHPQ